MTNHVELSIILPAYLEEENLRLLLPRIHQTAKEITNQYEIIVVDTLESMDGTPLACRDLDILYVNRENGNAYGDAIRTGIARAQGEFIIFMDADGSHHPAFIKNLWDEKDNHDIVIASRYIEGGHTENSKVLVLMSKIVNMGYAIFLNINCKDVSNSFKLYRKELLKELKLTCNNFDVVEEILFKIIRKNRSTRIKELPFSFKQRMFGETKRNLPLFILTYIFTLIKLKFFS